jgi:hypothetical protein
MGFRAIKDKIVSAVRGGDKPVLFGPDGRAVSSEKPEPARIYDGQGQPVKRQLSPDDIEGLDYSKPQFIYARTEDGRAATHGNDLRFFAHELDPGKMKEVDPKVVYVGSTTPRPLPDPEPAPVVEAPVYRVRHQETVLGNPHKFVPRNRHERRTMRAMNKRDARI